MAMCYVQVTDIDVQQEFHVARRNAIKPHCVPALALPAIHEAGVAGILKALDAGRHLLELYRHVVDSKMIRRDAQYTFSIGA